MIRKVFFQKTETGSYTLVYGDYQTPYEELYDVFSALRNNYAEYWINTSAKDGMVTIWSDWSIQRKANFKFKTQEDQDSYDQDYFKYLERRFKDMPRVDMTAENYEKLQKQFEQLQIDKPPYFVISQNSEGWVSLDGKEELTDQDKKEVEEDTKKFWKIYNLRKAYVEKYPLKRLDWAGVESELYEADYLDPEDLPPKFFKD